jgi:hypothetical protein
MTKRHPSVRADKAGRVHLSSTCTTIGTAMLVAFCLLVLAVGILMPLNFHVELEDLGMVGRSMRTVLIPLLVGGFALRLFGKYRTKERFEYRYSTCAVCGYDISIIAPEDKCPECGVSANSIQEPPSDKND